MNVGRARQSNNWWIAAAAFVAMLGIHIVWIQWFGIMKSEPLRAGVIALDHDVLSSGEVLRLDGDWNFYPRQLLDPEQLPKATSQSMLVPDNWRGVSDQSEAVDRVGYGTYQLLVRTHPGDEEKYGIYFPSIQSAAIVFINGEEVARSGVPAESADQTEAVNLPLLVKATPDEQGEIQLIVQVANFVNSQEGGIHHSPLFGQYEILNKRQQVSAVMQGVLFIIYLMHAFYAFYLYLIGVRNKGLLHFSLILVFLTIALGGNSEKLLLQVFPISYIWDYKIKGICLALGGYSVLRSMIKPTQSRYHSLILLSARIASVLLTITILFRPVDLLKFSWAFPVYIMFCSAVALIEAIRTLRGPWLQDGYRQLIAIALFQVVMWEYIDREMNFGAIFYPIDLFVAIICLTTLWFRDYKKTIDRAVELTELLKRQDRNKDEFLVNTSHELRNPLHGILNMTQSVMEREKSRLSTQGREELELVQSIGQRMNIMLGDLLDVVKLKDKGIQLQLSPVCLQGQVTEMTESLQFLIGGKPVKLINEVPASLPKIIADDSRLQQVLYNLLHNAIKFTNAGVICVRAEAKRDHVMIEVTDTGIGIEKEQLKRIFLPYEQAEDTVSTQGGFGLGLGICRKIVELHGGELEVRSTVGVGSHFILILPQPLGWQEEKTTFNQSAIQLVATQQSVDEEAMESFGDLSEAPEMSFRKKDQISILAVDDDPVNLRVLTTVLTESDGFELLCLSKPSEVMDNLHKRPWDLVILDVMMPDISGFMLTAMIRERFDSYELPILMLTARDRVEDMETGLLAGANDYVCKPVNTIELRARVRTLTGFKRAVYERLVVESSWMQAQIKPHFIMNTLNSIMALSEIDKGQMQNLINEFSVYLRASYHMHQREKMVVLYQELDLIKAYLRIKHVRFGDRLKVDWEIADELETQMPPLLIHPLVENAVIHGVLRRARGGIVRISVKRSEDRLCVTVSDDGGGMSEPQIQEVLDGRDRHGFSLYNTHQRLRQRYGQGLEIVSKPDEGTVVRFSIPLRVSAGK